MCMALSQIIPQTRFANQAAMISTVNSEEWRLEVERVTPNLKVQIANDNKDWRVHLENMEHHKQVILKGNLHFVHCTRH